MYLAIYCTITFPFVAWAAWLTFVTQPRRDREREERRGEGR